MKTRTAFRPQHLIALLMLGMIACSGGSSGEPAAAVAPQDIAVTIAPDAATLAPTAHQSFAATVSGTIDESVTWSVVEGAAGGSVASDGTYAAPSAAGTYHVTVRSNADPTKSATATITVTASPPQTVVVAVSPKTTSVVVRGSLTFTCSVTGATDTACAWSVQEGSTSGSVTTAGVYTAPSTAGTYHVIAASRADPSKSDTATVTVTATPPTVAVAVSPTTASLTTGGSRTFACTVTGSTDTVCTWSVQEGSTGGSVTTTGVYTAPSIAGTYHVVATSRADTSKTATSTITVTAPAPVTVAISPTTASVDACQTYTFRATVTGSTNTAVTWTVTEGSAGGSVSTDGVYTAPSTGGTYHVVATSQADPTKSQSATLTVTERIVSVSVSPATITVAPSGTAQFTATVTTTCGAFTQTQALAVPN